MTINWPYLDNEWSKSKNNGVIVFNDPDLEGLVIFLTSYRKIKFSHFLTFGNFLMKTVKNAKIP